MTTKTTKKTAAPKKPAEKKVTEAKKPVAKKVVAAKKTVEEKVVETPKATEKKTLVKTVSKVENKKTEKVKAAPEAEKKAVVKTDGAPAAKAVEDKKSTEFGATPLSHTLFVMMTVILWAFLTAWVVIEVNYDVTIEHKDAVARRIEQRMVRLEKQKAKGRIARKAAQRKAIKEKVFDKHLMDKKAPSDRKMPRKDGVPSKKVKKQVPPPLKLAERKAAFIESEYAPYEGTGKAVIEGNACFELNDGTKKCFENADVFINPVTTYSDEWYNRGWAGKEFLAKADERAIKFNKMIKSGKDGAFKFEGLQPGSYYVGAMVCLPQAADSKKCSCTRFASKVTMKNRVKTTLKQVFPEKSEK